MPDYNYDAWYKVSTTSFVEAGGETLLKKYKGSLSALLSKVLPEVPWNLHLFTKLPQNYWSDMKTQRNFMENLGKKFGMDFSEAGKVSMDNWYKVSSAIVIENGGESLLRLYNWSLYSTLTSIFPEFHFDPLKFAKAPQNYWSDVSAQKRFLDDLVSRFRAEHKQVDLGDDDPLDVWYRIPKRYILHCGGGGLLAAYEGDLFALLTAVYPHHGFKRWRFQFLSLPEEIRKDPQILSEARSFVEKKLNIKNSSDWNRVTKEDLHRLGALKVLPRGKRDLLGELSDT